MPDLGGYLYPESGDEEEEPDTLSGLDPIIAFVILFIIGMAIIEATGQKAFA